MRGKTTMDKYVNALILNVFSIVLASSFDSCASLRGKDADPSDVKPTHYTLRLETEQKQIPPLPSYTPIMVDWHYKSGEVVSKLGFKGWDFNGDKRFDMIQAVEDSGAGETVFDFDFDGEIDLRKLVKPTAIEKSLTHKTSSISN
jgi:hypothetical protein